MGRARRECRRWRPDRLAQRAILQPGDTKYDTFETLFERAEGYFTATAVGEMIANGIAADKILVGKPVTSGDATNTGWMSATDLAAAFSNAESELGWSAGGMTWQYTSDPDGAFVAEI